MWEGISNLTGPKHILRLGEQILPPWCPANTSSDTRNLIGSGKFRILPINRVIISFVGGFLFRINQSSTANVIKKYLKGRRHCAKLLQVESFSTREKMNSHEVISQWRRSTIALFCIMDDFWADLGIFSPELHFCAN